MPDTTHKAKRLNLQQWKGLVTRRLNEGSAAAFTEELRHTMPLRVASGDLGLFAVSTGAPEIIDIVYSGITPGSHIAYHFDKKIPIGQFVFEAILRFRARFQTRLSFQEITMIIGYAIDADDPEILRQIREIDEQLVLAALRSDLSMVERLGPRMAIPIAEHMTGWVYWSGKKMLGLFTTACGEGRIKTIGALIASGLEPHAPGLAQINTKTNPLMQAIEHHDRYPGSPLFPESLIRLLAYLDPETPCSHHAALPIRAFFAANDAAAILSMKQDARIAGMDRTDWNALRAT